MKIGFRSIREVDKWTDLPTDVTKIKEPTILCFGGDYTYNKRNANFVCKSVQYMTGIKPIINDLAQGESCEYRNINMIGLAYDKPDDNAHLNTDEKLALIKKLFLPLLRNDLKERLPVDVACKNISLITIFAHCRGFSETNKLIKSLYIQTKNLGYTEQEAQKIIGTITCISFAPEPECETEHFDSNSQYRPPIFRKILIKSFSDPLFGEIYKNDYTRLTGKKDFSSNNLVLGEVCNDKVILNINEMSTITYFVSRLTTNPTLNEHGLEILCRNETNYKSETTINTRNKHGDIIKTESHYPGVNADFASRLAGCAICNSLITGIMNNCSETFIEPQTITEMYQELSTFLNTKGYVSDENNL